MHDTTAFETQAYYTVNNATRRQEERLPAQPYPRLRAAEGLPSPMAPMVEPRAMDVPTAEVAPRTAAMTVPPMTVQPATVADEMRVIRSEFERHDAQLVQELQRMEQRLERVEAEEAAQRPPAMSPPLLPPYMQPPPAPQLTAELATLGMQQPPYAQLSPLSQPAPQMATFGAQQALGIPVGEQFWQGQEAEAFRQQEAFQQEALRQAFLRQEVGGALPLQASPPQSFAEPLAQPMMQSGFLRAMTPASLPAQPIEQNFGGRSYAGLKTWLPGLPQGR